MAQCSELTAKGEPCKNRAVGGETVCAAHGGRVARPLKKLEDLKYGFYVSSFREAEYADLIVYAENLDLMEELAVLQVRLRRILEYIDAHEETMTPFEYSRLNSLVFEAVKTIQDLKESLGGSKVNHWDIVLDQLSIELGMDL